MNIEELIERLDHWYIQTGAPSYRLAAQGLREQQAEIQNLKDQIANNKDMYQQVRTKHLPDCMMPDGAEPCVAYSELQALCESNGKAEAEIERLRSERDHYRDKYHEQA